ncbi:MAG: hypothetical protein ABFC34_13520 [Methanobacterium sp.]
MNREEILELCASNPEAIIDYIKGLEPTSNFSFHLNPPKRPDCSLDLYRADRREEICGYIYNDGRIADPWDAYADGYLAAVKKLIEVAKRNEFMVDTFGYPIFYLFYHYLELRLKRIIRCGEFFITPTHKKQDLSTHNIVSLWERCKTILKEIEGWKEYTDLSEDIKKDYETIDHFIKEIARDTTSQAFRYPDNLKKQKPFLVDDKEQQFLNVTNLSYVVDWLSYRLDGISMAIAVQLSFYGDYY